MKFFISLILSIAACSLAAQALPPLPQEWLDAARVGEVGQIQARVAQLALEKSHDPAVLSQARRVIAENQALFPRLAVLAEKHQIMMASGPTVGQEDAYQKLRFLPEKSFNQAYWGQQTECEKALCELCARGSAESSDPALQSILASYIQSAEADLSSASR